MYFLDENFWIYTKFTEICPLGSNWQYGSIFSDNGLVSNKRQAIILSNDDMFCWPIYTPRGLNESMTKSEYLDMLMIQRLTMPLPTHCGFEKINDALADFTRLFNSSDLLTENKYWTLCNNGRQYWFSGSSTVWYLLFRTMSQCHTTLWHWSWNTQTIPRTAKSTKILLSCLGPFH